MRISSDIGSTLCLMAMLTGLATTALADPYAGYVYPAGGKAGTTFEVHIGGQRLTRVKDAQISGDGVELKFLEYIEPAKRAFNKARNARDTILSEIEEKKAKGESVEGIVVPVLKRIPRNPRAQPNAQIEETARFEITIAPDAKPGVREIRLSDKRGTSNPIIFHVGDLREVTEQLKPANFRKGSPPAVLKTMPLLVNGRILPGETDRYRFHAKKGQHLVFITQARELIPYLADAVPGWFQAVISVHDSKGRELALVDDYRFHPDPVLFFNPEEDGEYELRIRDSIYRGREDFVYRIAMGQLPFVTGISPLGGRVGETTSVQLKGVNLKTERLNINTPSPGIHSALHSASGISQVLLYAVDDLPEVLESEPNNRPRKDQRVTLPCTVNGVIESEDDVDVFRFKGTKGQDLVAEVLARRLDSPLDSIITLTDVDGDVIAANDDHKDKSVGLLTHHADSYIRCVLPHDGTYYLQLRDVQKKGSTYHAYRLRLGPSRPDFALRIVPSSISVPASGSAPVTVHVLRKDGFDGEVQIKLKDDARGTMTLNGVVPAGVDKARLTLMASKNARKGPMTISAQGIANIAGDQAKRDAVPTDDRMQAFLWRFLVPTQEWAVNVRFADQVALLPQIPENSVLMIPAGDSADFRMRIQIASKRIKGSMTLTLDNPPDGVSMQPVTVTEKDRSVRLSIDADEDIVKIGDTGHLIVTGLAGKNNFMVGMSRAIAFEIVE